MHCPAYPGVGGDSLGCALSAEAATAGRIVVGFGSDGDLEAAVVPGRTVNHLIPATMNSPMFGGMAGGQGGEQDPNMAAVKNVCCNSYQSNRWSLPLEY